MLAAPVGDSLRAKHDRVIIAVYLFRALQRTGLADLRVSSLNVRRGVMHFKVFGKASKTRYIPIHLAALSAIEDYLNEAGHRDDRNGALFRPVRNNVTGTLDKTITGGAICAMVK